MKIRWYCVNCLQYLQGHLQLSGFEIRREKPIRCENQRCDSYKEGMQARFPFELPDDWPESLGNDFLDATNDQMAVPGPGYRPGLWRRILRAMGLATLALSLHAQVPAVIANRVIRCTGCERDDKGRIRRDHRKPRRFLKAVGWDEKRYPLTRKENGRVVQMYVVDHIIPLACGAENGGYDDIGNMQIQTAEAGKLKDAWERDSAVCGADAQGQALYLLERGQLMPNPHSRTVPALHAYESARQLMSEEDERRANATTAGGRSAGAGESKPSH